MPLSEHQCEGTPLLFLRLMWWALVDVEARRKGRGGFMALATKGIDGTSMIDALARVLGHRFAIAYGDLPSASLRRISAP